MILKNASKRDFIVLNKDEKEVILKKGCSLDVLDKQAESLLQMYRGELIDLEAEVKAAKAEASKAEVKEEAKPVTKSKVSVTANATVTKPDTKAK